MESTTIEGTWEEIQQYSSRLAGHRLCVTVLDEKNNGNEESREKGVTLMAVASGESLKGISEYRKLILFGQLLQRGERLLAEKIAAAEVEKD